LSGTVLRVERDAGFSASTAFCDLGIQTLLVACGEYLIAYLAYVVKSFERDREADVPQISAQVLLAISPLDGWYFSKID
jgi:hypothetical protein